MGEMGGDREGSKARGRERGKMNNCKFKDVSQFSKRMLFHLNFNISILNLFDCCQCTQA